MENKNSYKVHFVIIGTSKIAESFLEIAADNREFKLEAVYSRDKEKAASFSEKYGAIKAYDNLEAMANDKEIDAVYIASPNSLHYEQAQQFIRAGKHILCEKALGSNRHEVENMIQSAKENQVILLEAMRSVHDPGFQVIKDNLYKIGKLRKTAFRYCRYSSRYDSFKLGEMHNIFDTKFSAGALMDIGIYCVEPMIALFGTPLSFQAESVILRGGIDGAGTILAKYDGMVAELSYSKISDSFMPSEIQGELGTMVIQTIYNPAEIRIRYQNGYEEKLETESSDNNMKYELETFINAVKGKKDISEYQQISYDAIKLMDAIREECGVIFPADKSTD